MPTFKHPCPLCGTFIERDVAACPKCGRADPFAPARCPSCRATIDDPGWIACPKCGTALTATTTGAADDGPAAAPREAAGRPAVPGPAAASTGTCSGCGSPLPAGARFCRECGTVVA
jgi:predicted amidophosphoribosyltransferase